MFRFVVVFFSLVCFCSNVNSEVKVLISEQNFTPQLFVEEEEYVGDVSKLDYKIRIKGAKGHEIRVEVDWIDENGKPVYDNIDEDEEASSYETYEIEDDNDVIEDYLYLYHGDLWLKPGKHKVSGSLRIYDETEDKYIPIPVQPKHTATVTSYRAAPGIVFTEYYTEHNEYHNGAKGMYVRYDFEANWLKGKDLKIVVGLFYKNGTKLYNIKGKADQTEGYATPGYTFTIYNDQWSFFPYAGIKLPKGKKTTLYAIIRVYDDRTGKLINSSPKMEFWVTN